MDTTNVESEGKRYCVYCLKVIEPVLEGWYRDSYSCYRCDCRVAKLEISILEMNEELLQKQEKNREAINLLKYKEEVRKLKWKFRVDE